MLHWDTIRPDLNGQASQALSEADGNGDRLPKRRQRLCKVLSCKLVQAPALLDFSQRSTVAARLVEAATSPRMMTLSLFAGSGAKFDGHTSYEMDYPAHAVQPRAPPAPVSANKSSAKFEGVSSYTVSSSAHQQN